MDKAALLAAIDFAEAKEIPLLIDTQPGRRMIVELPRLEASVTLDTEDRAKELEQHLNMLSARAVLRDECTLT